MLQRPLLDRYYKNAIFQRPRALDRLCTLSCAECELAAALHTPPAGGAAERDSERPTAEGERESPEIFMYPCKHTGRSSLALAGMWNYSASPGLGPAHCALTSAL